MAGDSFPCWACGKDTNAKLLTRLDEVSNLGGFAPGVLKRGGSSRICPSCLFKWSVLRSNREVEILRVSRLSAQSAD